MVLRGVGVVLGGGRGLGGVGLVERRKNAD